ncbi:MAG: phospholipase D-like domain-containing protein [Thermomicrobiales bacterium]|nr:phospholipase D-like domain-containing protein [Thermomicrobiales bacterium]
MKKLLVLIAASLILLATATIVASLGLIVGEQLPATRVPATIAEHNPAAPDIVEGIYVLPDDGPGPLIEELDAARNTIDIEIYLLTDEDILSALFRARDRGVIVRVLLEEDPYGGSNQQPEIYSTLAEGGIEVRWNTTASRFSHIKLIVIDHRVALIMNLNLTYSALNRNRELAVITTDPAHVDHAARIFEHDWTEKSGEIPGPLILSPDTSRATILGLIDSAEATLDIYAEVITDEEFIAHVEQALDRGVRVRIIMTQSYGQNMLDEPVGQLVRAGASLHTLADPYIHAKLIMVDGSRAFVGSQNYTSTSMDKNREVGIVISSSWNLERLRRVFEKDFSMGIPVALDKPLDPDAQDT